MCAFPGHPAGEDIAGRGALQLLPLPQGFRDIRGQIHHPIHMPFTVIDADRALGKVEGSPDKAAHFAHAQAAP